MTTVTGTIVGLAALDCLGYSEQVRGMARNMGWVSTKQPIYSGPCRLVQRFPRS